MMKLKTSSYLMIQNLVIYQPYARQSLPNTALKVIFGRQLMALFMTSAAMHPSTLVEKRSTKVLEKMQARFSMKYMDPWNWKTLLSRSV